MTQIKCIKCSATSTLIHGSLYLCNSCYKRAIKQAAKNYSSEMEKIKNEKPSQKEYGQNPQAKNNPQ
jgi:hypothetical protein